VIVTDVPAVVEEGEILAILAEGSTVKVTALVFAGLESTVTGPVVAPGGTTISVMEVDPKRPRISLISVPLSRTRYEFRLAPAIEKFDPTGPDVGVRLMMVGKPVKLTPLLRVPPTVTTTRLLVLATAGTGTTMLLSLQLVGVVATSLDVFASTNLTVLVP